MEANQLATRQAALEKIPVVSLATTTVDTTTSRSATAVRTLQISETPTGWLNVRSGPGTSFAPVGRVNPGEVYPLLAEEGEWYRIKFEREGQAKEGWVAKQYVIIKN